MQAIKIQCLDGSAPDFADRLARIRQALSPSSGIVSPRGQALTQRVFGRPLSPQQVVEQICADVRQQGTPALLRYSEALDGHVAAPESLRVPKERIRAAHREASSDFLASVRRIRKNILEFQQAILHRDVRLEPSPGVVLEQRYQPLERIGICVPGGAAAYPSTVLMTAVPAQAAGVSQIALVAPPTELGAFNRDVLALCGELGIDEVYAVGGAQAVAALAYGLPEIPAVDKIVGPGSLFVALAKKHVYGHVDIDSIAGPSEVVIIADDSSPPEFIAADMLAQAEHSPGASFLITWLPDVRDRVHAALEMQCAGLSRAELTQQSLTQFGAYLLARDQEHAIAISNSLAPEHLHVATAQPRELLPKLRHSGAVFLGPYAPVALGDYAAGPSHVLPTGGTARWASGLSSNHFLRSSSVIEYSAAALAEIAPHAERIAECEGLTAHRDSLSIRQSASLPRRADAAKAVAS